MRLFEILDKLNVMDTENGTSNVGICNEVVSVDKKGNNGFVTIGIPADIAQKLVLTEKMDNKSLVLLIIDLDVYNKVKSENKP